MVVCQPGSMDMAKSKDTDGVDREHQRRGDAGQDQVGHFVVAPLPVRAAPAQGEEAVDNFSDLRRRAVAQGRQVGNQTQYTRTGPRP